MRQSASGLDLNISWHVFVEQCDFPFSSHRTDGHAVSGSLLYWEFTAVINNDVLRVLLTCSPFTRRREHSRVPNAEY